MSELRSIANLETEPREATVAELLAYLADKVEAGTVHADVVAELQRRFKGWE